MSVKSRTLLKQLFLTGSTPRESDFGDLIDSSLLAEDIVDGVSSTSATLPLSAASGKGLSDSITLLTERVATLENTEVAFAANYYNKADVDAKFTIIDGVINAMPYSSQILTLQTGLSTLSTTVAGKSATSHAHGISDIPGLQTAIDGKTTQAYVDSVAGGLVSAINNLSLGTDESADVLALQSALAALQSTVSQLPTDADLATKADSGHDHTISNITDLPANYYNKTQTDALLSAGLPAESHAHTESDITDLDKYTKSQTELKISDHAGLTDNPHGVTGGQVGLGNVENKSVAEIFSSTEAQGYANTLPGAALPAHVADTSNPHSVSKTQVGLANVPDIDVEALLNTHLAASNPHSIDLSFFDVYSQAETDSRVLFHVDAVRYAFTPLSDTDPAGAVGDIAYDVDNVYVKTGATKWLTMGSVERDIEVNGSGSVGGYSNGETITKGTTLTEVLEELLIQSIPPTYTSPSVGLSTSPSSTQEIGATVSYALNPSFSQNDAGSLTQVVLERDNAQISTSSSTSQYTDSNRTVQAGNVTYRAEATYDQGPVKNDNLGNPSPGGQIQAGTIGVDKNVAGAYRNWYGGQATNPTNQSEVRALSHTYGNTFTINTGSDQHLIIAIPSTKSLVSVIDLDALNADITANYTLSSSLTQVNDGGGSAVNYKVYVLSLSSAYSSSHRHSVTLG